MWQRLKQWLRRKPKLVAEIVNEDAYERVTYMDPTPPGLTYATERDRQKALQVIDDLIQRTDDAVKRALYEKQKVRISQASIQEHATSPMPSLGPFPRQ